MIAADVTVLRDSEKGHYSCCRKTKSEQNINLRLIGGNVTKEGEMPSKDDVLYWVAIWGAVAWFLIATAYSILAISVNAGRISQLLQEETTVQAKSAEIAKGGQPADLQGLRDDLANATGNRDSLRGQINYGKDEFWSLTFWHCVVPLEPKCFHRNSSETNNLYIAMSGGILGVCLFLLLTFRDKERTASSLEKKDNPFVLFVCFIPIGMIIGLLTLYLLRGTRGALLTPVADVVQVENPYGIAFASTVAAFYSDRIIAFLSSIVPAPRT